MDSAAKESILSERLSECLGGLILKDEQKLAVEALMSAKDVLAVLPTGFGKSVIYQNFIIAKDPRPSLFFLLRSIIGIKGFLYLGITFLALTGTADVKINQTIMKDLSFKKDRVVLDISPERSNIRFTIIKKKEKTISNIFSG